MIEVVTLSVYWAVIKTLVVHTSGGCVVVVVGLGSKKVTSDAVFRLAGFSVALTTQLVGVLLVKLNECEPK